MTEWGIDTLFNPGKRHMDEEKRRLQSTREEVGDSSGGRRIDLESGTVRISRPAGRPADESADAGVDADAEARGEDVAEDGYLAEAKVEDGAADQDQDAGGAAESAAAESPAKL